MISKCRPLSIHTVRFKNQLSLLLTRSSSSIGFDQERVAEHYTPSESTQCSSAHLTNSIGSLALKISAKNGFLSEAKQLHSHLIKLGSCLALSLQNQILHSYEKCSEFRDAHKLFDEMPERNIVSWNTVVRMAASSDWGFRSKVELGFCYFRRMLLEMVPPDSTTMNALIRACIALNDLRIGRQLHCFVVKVRLNFDRFVGSATVDLYGKLGLVRDARCAFDEMGSRDLVSWNVMVSVYALNSLMEEAFRVFELMQLEGVRGDEFTFSSLLSACSFGGCCELGKQFHGLITKLSFVSDIQVASALVDVYAKSGHVIEAQMVFDGMAVRNLVSWNTMIVGYGQQGYGKEAMKLFMDMFRRDVKPDEITIASIVSSCGNLSAVGEITQIHSYITKSGFDAHLSVANAIIVAYSNCGNLANASLCFNSVIEPDLVTFTSILRAHAFHGHVEESIDIFEMMVSSGLRPDNIAFLEILSACSHGGLIREGLRYFKLMVNDYDIVPNSEHHACLVDLLGRAGLMDEASEILISGGPVALESNTLGAFVGASKANGHVKLAEWAAGKLFELEPKNPVNYTLMSNMYASVGQWDDAARVRKGMNYRCDSKVPGCSWIEIAAKVHTFRCSDTSHPLAKEVYAMLGMLIRPMKDDDCA